MVRLGLGFSQNQCHINLIDVSVYFGRDALWPFDAFIPPLMCIPLLIELVLRVIYEPGHAGSQWGTAEMEKKPDGTHIKSLHWLKQTLCYPCQALFPCFTLWACDTVGVVIDVAFFREPLLALDVAAISCFVLDRWVLVSLIGSGYVHDMVHIISNVLQILRLLRVWAVNITEDSNRNCPEICKCGEIGTAFATWLVTVSTCSTNEGPGGHGGPEDQDVEKQVRATNAARVRAPGMQHFLESSPLIGGW